MSEETSFLAYDASMMCVFQRFQQQPYQGMNNKDIKQAVGQQSAFKVPAHVSRDTLGNFYSAINNHCGVDIECSANMPLLTKLRETAPEPSRADALLSTSNNAASSLDWRVRQIRQNEGRPKICHHYTSKEGCMRGAACSFTHSK